MAPNSGETTHPATGNQPQAAFSRPINSDNESRSQQFTRLISSALPLFEKYIATADSSLSTQIGPVQIVEHHAPRDLQQILNIQLPRGAGGEDAVLQAIQQAFKYSVNTWHQGFGDKLYHGASPVGVLSETVLAALNQNVHVYSAAPYLTIIEKETTRALAKQFGMTGPYAGGIAQPGGSASNATAIAVARAVKFPDIKERGNAGREFVVFASEHSHYSVLKAAQLFGIGSNNVVHIAVDDHGRMDAGALENAVRKSEEDGKIPFIVVATAGTTVLGAFDPLPAIADICNAHDLWMHVDACWGGGFIFSDTLRIRMAGIERADSIAFNPHKMLGVPLTCSFLLSKDLREFGNGMKIHAPYLFHSNSSYGSDAEEREVHDLAQLTPQCGRRGDAFKMYLAWSFSGTTGFATEVEDAYAVAQHLFTLASAHQNFVMVNKAPLPCLQVSFYWAPGGRLQEDVHWNSKTTRNIVRALVSRGVLVDYSLAERGEHLRFVVSVGMRKETIERLVESVDEIGKALI